MGKRFRSAKPTAVGDQPWTLRIVLIRKERLLASIVPLEEIK